MRNRKKTGTLSLVCILFATAAAATVFEATLDGLQNVPPTPGVTATGVATLTLNEDQTELTYFIQYTGLSSNEVSAHIHNANAKSNGPIVFTLPAGNPKSGVWQIPAHYVTELFAERLYVNIHSESYVAGEIRGQIRQKAVPVEPTTIGALKARYAGP